LVEIVMNGLSNEKEITYSIIDEFEDGGFSYETTGFLPISQLYLPQHDLSNPDYIFPFEEVKWYRDSISDFSAEEMLNFLVHVAEHGKMMTEASVEDAMNRAVQMNMADESRTLFGFKIIW
ncbi:MAG: hypothetical protein ACRC6B_09105, partial [Fusobacteriaceae bacterium]